MKIATGNRFSSRIHPIQIMILLIIFSLLLFPVHFMGTVSSATGKTNLSVVASVVVGARPEGIAYDAANGYLYVAASDEDSVYVIDGATNTLIGAVSVGLGPTSIAFDPANGYLYTTDFFSRDVAVINGANNSLVERISVGGLYPDGIALDSSTGDLYVGYYYSGYPGSRNATVIYGNTNQVTGNISLGSNGSQYMAFDPKNGYVYATDTGYNVSVINGFTKTVVATITTRGGPILYDPSNDNLYTTDGYLFEINGSTNDVQEFGTLENLVIANFAYNSLNGDLYWVTYENGNNLNYVYIVSPPANIIANVSAGPAGSDPNGAAFDPSNGYLYVTDFLTNTVVVIANTSVATTSTPIASTITKTSTVASITTVASTATITSTATSTLTATINNSGNYPIEAAATIVVVVVFGSLAAFYFLRFRRTKGALG